MTTGTAPSSSTPRQSSPLAVGSRLGDRFDVLEILQDDNLGRLLRARDGKTSREVALRLLDPGWTGDAATMQALRAQVKLAAKVSHPGLACIYGVGRSSSHGHYMVSEWLQGAPLSELVAARRAQGKRFSIRAVFNLIGHATRALAAAHAQLPHTALRPEVVRLSPTGQVGITELGLSSALALTGGWQRLSAAEQACVAPEIKAGRTPEAAADVFGLGALLYVLLTNRFPHEEFIAPSQAHPHATPELDGIVMRCLDQDPTKRYGSPLQLLEALEPLLAAAPIDPDEDRLVAAAESAPEPAVGRSSSPRGAPPPPPAAAAPPTADMPPGARPSMVDGPQAAARQSEVDVGGLLAKITENDAACWMVVKDGLDHGPFSGRELVHLIVTGEVLAEHGLLNLETGERQPVGEHPELQICLEQYQLHKAEQDHQEALVRTEKLEKRSTVAKVTILAASVGVLGMIAVGYLLTRPEAQDSEVAEADLADLYESAQVKIQGTVGILGPSRGGRRGGSRSSRNAAGASRSPGGGLSYEDAMNQAMDLGDSTRGGGERQLTSSVIAGVMNRQLNSLFSCVSQELRRGGRLGKVRIDLAIAGSGKVLGATVNPGSAAFQSCVSSKVTQIRFPEFPAPRMGARYSFDVD